jgi:predicted Zn-dependent protease
MRIIFHLILLAGGFAGVFFSLSRIDFIGAANIEKISSKKAHELGELMIESVLLSAEEVKDSTALAFIDSLKRPLCVAGGLDADSIIIHLIRKDEVNAFALPGNHIVLHTSLFEFAKDPGEVAGVLGHELGHLKLNHIEKKLVKEVGLSILFTIAGGEAGQQILKEIVKQISSTSFDREYESEADAFAVEVLAKSGVDPERLSDFMFRVSQKSNMPEELVFLSTHPDGKDRAAEIIKLSKEQTITKKPILKTPWEEVQKAMD